MVVIHCIRAHVDHDCHPLLENSMIHLIPLIIIHYNILYMWSIINHDPSWYGSETTEVVFSKRGSTRRHWSWTARIQRSSAQGKSWPHHRGNDGEMDDFEATLPPKREQPFLLVCCFPTASYLLVLRLYGWGSLWLTLKPIPGHDMVTWQQALACSELYAWAISQARCELQWPQALYRRALARKGSLTRSPVLGWFWWSQCDRSGVVLPEGSSVMVFYIQNAWKSLFPTAVTCSDCSDSISGSGSGASSFAEPNTRNNPGTPQPWNLLGRKVWLICKWQIMKVRPSPGWNLIGVH